MKVILQQHKHLADFNFNPMNFERYTFEDFKYVHRNNV